MALHDPVIVLPADITAEEWTEVLETSRRLADLLDQLEPLLPKLRDLTPVLASITQGGPGALVGLLGALMRG